MNTDAFFSFFIIVLVFGHCHNLAKRLVKVHIETVLGHREQSLFYLKWLWVHINRKISNFTNYT